MLRVETGRWQGIQRRLRNCDMCGTDAIQDEKHVVLECRALEGVRNKYNELLDASDGDMKKLMLSQSDRLAWFVHDCMRAIDASNRHLQDNVNEDGEQPL